jgi:tetratricopeptide (TPR) repeat protein
LENLKISNLVKQGKEAFSKNDLKTAYLLFSEVIDVDPNSIDAFFYLGNIFHMRGELGKAIRSFNRVLELDPKHTDASISLSVLLNDIGKYEEAKEVFEKANQHLHLSQKQGVVDHHINKKFSLKHYELAEMYASYQRFDEAVFEYNKASGLDPENLEIRIKIAKAYSKKGFTAKAFEELKKLKNEYPAYLPAKMALGLLYYSVGNVIEAHGEWQSILYRDPHHQEALMYMNLSRNASETNLSY